MQSPASMARRHAARPSGCGRGSKGFRQEDLDRCLREYRLVKANLMRGTVHL